MKVAYERLVNPDEMLDHLRRLAPRTVVFDVEPLVAYWDTDQATLATGVATILRQVLGGVANVEVVVFATNSSRRLPANTSAARHPTMRYLAGAAKPLRTAPYLDLPRPGVVVGDQVATDGLLAWRLGYSFLHYRPPRGSVPAGPRIMNLLGRPLRPVLFTRAV
jgi:predicted HAD superfamily phosphohydrolase YqeG